MKKIGITGSIASGKTTASKILSARRGPLFSADKVVKRLYKRNKFKKLILKKFNIKNSIKFKNLLREKILKNNNNIKKLEMLIHPLVRKEMKKFSLLNKYKKTTFYEIPLLIESKLMKYFDVIIFIKTKKKIRLKRFEAKGGEKKLFDLLDKKQMNDVKKIKYCDHVVVNERNINILKKKLLDIINSYV
jgi:dephospho-CoA kinase